MRQTLHLAAADDYPAYAQLARQPRHARVAQQYAHFDEAQVTAELSAWFAEPRTNREVRERVGATRASRPTPWPPVMFARTLLPLVQVPPAGHWEDHARRVRVDPRPRPRPEEASARSCSPATWPRSARPAVATSAAWAGVAQRDFAGVGAAKARGPPRRARHRVVRPPGQPLPPASTRAPGAPARPLGPAAAGPQRPRAHLRARGRRRCKLTLSGRRPSPLTAASRRAGRSSAEGGPRCGSP